MKRQRGPQRILTLDAPEILSYVRRGWTLGAIGSVHGVTRQAVSARLRRAGADPLTRGRRAGVKYAPVSTT